MGVKFFLEQMKPGSVIAAPLFQSIKGHRLCADVDRLMSTR